MKNLAIPGVIFCAVAGGSLGAVASVLLGFAPVMHLICYIGGGICAVLAYVLRLAKTSLRRV